MVLLPLGTQEHTQLALGSTAAWVSIAPGGDGSREGGGSSWHCEIGHGREFVCQGASFNIFGPYSIRYFIQ